MRILQKKILTIAGMTLVLLAVWYKYSPSEQNHGHPTSRFTPNRILSKKETSLGKRTPASSSHDWSSCTHLKGFYDCSDNGSLIMSILEDSSNLKLSFYADHYSRSFNIDGKLNSQDEDKNDYFSVSCINGTLDFTQIFVNGFQENDGTVIIEKNTYGHRFTGGFDYGGSYIYGSPEDKDMILIKHKQDALFNYEKIDDSPRAIVHYPNFCERIR